MIRLVYRNLEVLLLEIHNIISDNCLKTLFKAFLITRNLNNYAQLINHKLNKITVLFRFLKSTEKVKSVIVLNQLVKN
jgi:hypothetical protein